MADLVELDVVVKQKGLKESLSTVERLERQIIKAAKAVDQNRISQERYNRILLNAKRQYEALGVSSQKATAEVRRFADANRNLAASVTQGGVAAQQTARKTNQLGVLMQQTGYQVGDFAVQVQSGTNVMVALGQQATQLVGTFAMLARSTAAIAAFSALGVIVPIVTAIAGAFMRAAKSAEEAEKKVTGLAKTLKDYQQEQRAFAQGITTDQLGLVDRINAIKELQQEFLKIAETASGITGSKQAAEAEAVIDVLNALLLKASEQQVALQEKINKELRDRVISMGEANKLASIENKLGKDSQQYRDEARRQAERALELEIQASGVGVHVANRLRDRLKTEYDIIDAKAIADAAEEAREDREEKAQKLAERRFEALMASIAANDELNKLHSTELKNLRDQVSLQNTLAKFGENSVEYQNEVDRIAKENYKQSRLDVGIRGKRLALELEIFETLQKQTREANEQVQIDRLKLQAAQANITAAFKITQNEVELLRAKGKNNEADDLAVKLAGDRAYQAVMAKANTDAERDALEGAAREAESLAQEAARVANATSDAKDEAKELEAALKEAARAMDGLVNVGDNIDKAFAKAQARVKALKEGLDATNAATIAGQRFDLEKAFEEAKKAATGPDGVIAATEEYEQSLKTLEKTASALAEGKKLEEAARNSEKAMDKAAKAAEELKEKIEELEDAADPFRAYNRELKILDTMLGKNQISQKAYNKAVDDLNDGLGDTIPIVGEVEQAFADWISRGLRDFKDFVGSIKDMFIRLLADMAAAALRNRILIPIATGMSAGFGSSAAAQTMASGAGSFASGTIGSMLAGGASALGSGFMAGVQGFMGGGFGGYMNTLSATALNAGPMATLGAALPAILAVTAVIGLFTKKTKLLDSGLRTTVEGFDVAIETFKQTQSSRLFGLLKGRKKTTYEAASAEIADPFINAIGDMQQSIMDAASTLGIGEEYFKNFSYEFKLSLKGLTEDQQLQKINEEILKMGDSFASLTGHFENMNDLMATAQQRYDLETRLLQLQGDEAALLARQRELEVAATHELNQALLTQIHTLEDAMMAAEAARIAAEEAARQIGTSPIEAALVGLVSNAEEAAKLSNLSVEDAFSLVKRSVDARKKEITDAFNTIMDSIQDRIKAAQDDVSVSQRILSSLESASGGTDMTRAAGMSYLRSLRGASRISDEKKLDEALRAVANPSEDLYTTFTDYQRDFQDQANVIRDLEEQASLQLSTDEKTLLQLQEEADQARQNHEAQMEALDAQLQLAVDQYNALMGIDTSVQEVGTAIAALSISIQKAQAAQAELDKLKAEQAAAASVGKTFGEAYGTGGTYKGFDQAALSGSGDLLNAAAMLGVDTTGKTGAQIQQDISNASGMAVSLDNATRSQQFALGGYHSGGVRMVGERGPELEATGPSRVFSASQTRRMIQNPDLVEAVKAMKEEITELRNEQRQLGINNNKYTKRTYDLYRQWDAEGLPAERT